MIPKPTDAELSILRALWVRGPSTVRQVFDRLARERDVGYTTVLKLLQIMTEKGLVHRDETGKLHVYSPSLPEYRTQRHLLQDLMDKAFHGSAAQLVIQALSTQPSSLEELAEIRRLIDRVEQGGEP
jgi:BlaI family transcriptional regulator, penicillinase repressor